MRKVLTLCYVIEPERLLLGMKKAGLGTGKWNGFGGKVEQGERIEDAARRELKEEAGIDCGQLTEAGVLEFVYGGELGTLEVHVFLARAFSGEVAESEEMAPAWFAIKDIPYENMWPDDRRWMPLLLAGKKFRGTFLFEGKEKLISYTIEEL